MRCSSTAASTAARRTGELHRRSVGAAGCMMPCKLLADLGTGAGAAKLTSLWQEVAMATVASGCLRYIMAEQEGEGQLWGVRDARPIRVPAPLPAYRASRCVPRLGRTATAVRSAHGTHEIRAAMRGLVCIVSAAACGPGVQRRQSTGCGLRRRRRRTGGRCLGRAFLALREMVIC